MNKYAELLAKQNPYWEKKCQNCSYKNKLKTIEVFQSANDYSFVCSKCGVTNTIVDIPSLVKGIKKDFIKQGILAK